MRIGRTLGIGGGILVVLTLAAFFWIGANLELFMNRVEPVAVPKVSEEARALHAAAFVADMHADTLMLRGDLTQRSATGHVDLPRLQDGGVALQFLTAVTKVPLGFNIDATDGDRFDLLTLIGVSQLNAFATRDLLGRALLYSERLQDSVDRAGGALLWVRSVAELDQLIARRAADPRVVGALLGSEGAHPLGLEFANVTALHAAGFRMIGLAHFFDNAFSGSAHGLKKYGLTQRGRDLVRQMEQLGMVVDLAHVAAPAIDDVLQMATKPVVVSHTGVRGTCDNQRNLSDAQIQAIARNGGVIGIGYWDTAVCGTEMRYVTAAMRHVIAVAGDDYVGLGSDYDGATTVGFDTSQLPALTQQMMNEGMSEATIKKILGGNVVRVLRAVLPGQ
jgi:microsomal dipeptidase-like Zn-dependent dipeptidase